jgi:hypothetical protein
MAPWTTTQTTSSRSDGGDPRLHLHAYLDRRGEPAHLAPLSTRAAESVLQGPVVRRIFDLYARKRLGTIAIANLLRDESAPAPAAGWGHPAVHWMISNPTYAGRIRWRDRLFDGAHEPLIVDGRARIQPTYRLVTPEVCATSEKVGLVAVLSNNQTKTLFQRLTRRDWRQVRRPPAMRRDRARDGKLKFGTVSGAVLAVLARTCEPMRFIEIHASVEALLEMPVSRSSVKQFLSDERRHRKPRFVRLRRGVYQLLKDAA